MRSDTALTRRSDSTAPGTPTDLSKQSWMGALKRTVKEFRDDNLVDYAGALTYYGVLSIFPAILALVSLLGLLGAPAIQPLIDNLGRVAPGPAKDIVMGALESLRGSQTTGGILFVVAIGVAIWSASRYVASFMRTSNVIYEMPEGRPIWKKAPVRLAVTVAMLVLLAISAVIVVVTAGVAREAGQLIGAGDTAVTVWDIAKWPVLAAIVSLMFALLYWAAPNVKHLGFRWLTPGGILAVVLWLVASGGFALYVSNFGSFNQTYGTLAGVIIFLMWLWVSNIAVLLGAEFNAELERSHQLENGMPEEQEPYLQPRDTRKMSDEQRADLPE